MRFISLRWQVSFGLCLLALVLLVVIGQIIPPEQLVFFGALALILVSVISIWLWGAIRRLQKLNQLLPSILSDHTESPPITQVSNKTWWDEGDLLRQQVFNLQQRMLEMQNDIAERTLALEKMAMYDALTGLPNRNLFRHELQRAITKLQRQDELMALMFVDLDGFKQINDAMGHSAGDEVLRVVAHRLQSAVRSTDIVCRYGGDEFCVVLPSLAEQLDIHAIVEKIFAHLRKKISLSEHQFTLSASIGVAFCDDAEADIEKLVSQADIAMYAAKKDGRGRLRVYSQDLGAGVETQFELGAELELAMQRNEFCFALQPILALPGSNLVAFECLLHWQHPKRGLLPANQFMPLIHEPQQVNFLGRWIINRAINMLVQLKERGLGSLPVAINLSPSQFHDALLVQYVGRKLDAAEIRPENLIMEINTELMDKPNLNISRVMERCREKGICVALDHFGRGSASLTLLQQLNTQWIKLDADLIEDIANNESRLDIVKAMFQLTQVLNKQLVVQGVDEQSCFDALKSLGALYLQGGYLGAPISEAHFFETGYEQFLNHSGSESV